ncbi:hypothetical protein JXQ70_18330 [bacterium]|nr:hypothetical protein [bacterium]
MNRIVSTDYWERHYSMSKVFLFLMIITGMVVCSRVCAQENQEKKSEFREPPLIGFVFSINMASTRESQEFPFRDRLVYNYSPNPDLRFIEGKNFTNEEALQAVRYLLDFSKLSKLHGREWFSLSDKVWLNTPAEQVMTEAAALSIHTLFFIDLQSCALVQSINQQKTLFLYNSKKPEQTTVYDYFYNIRGRVALINVEHGKLLFQKTTNGLDFLSPRESKVDSKDALFRKMLNQFGDTLYNVLKEQHELVLTWQPEGEESHEDSK